MQEFPVPQIQQALGKVDGQEVVGIIESRCQGRDDFPDSVLSVAQPQHRNSSGVEQQHPFREKEYRSAAQSVAVQAHSFAQLRTAAGR